jgi:hypothetical protein
MAAWKEDAREVLKGIDLKETLIVLAGLERLGVPKKVLARFSYQEAKRPRRGEGFCAELSKSRPQA